jgi:hypothetical protein
LFSARSIHKNERLSVKERRYACDHECVR